MKQWKSILSMLLLGALVVTFSACGSNGSTSDKDANQAASEQSAAQETGTEESAGNVAGETEINETGTGESGAEEPEEKAEPEDTEKEETESSGSDTLVVYFSRTGEQYGVGVIEKGNTEIVADKIIEETGADRFRILPEDDYYPYTYDELTDIAKKEQNENARPAYAGEAPDLSGYSTIYIGAPVWWNDWPMIMYTFFEENADALNGKTLIPFSTHGGSGLSGFDKKLEFLFPESSIGEGLAISGTDAQKNQESVRDRVKEWIAGQ